MDTNNSTISIAYSSASTWMCESCVHLMKLFECDRNISPISSRRKGTNVLESLPIHTNVKHERLLAYILFVCLMKNWSIPQNYSFPTTLLIIQREQINFQSIHTNCTQFTDSQCKLFVISSHCLALWTWKDHLLFNRLCLWAETLS